MTLSDAARIVSLGALLSVCACKGTLIKVVRYNDVAQKSAHNAFERNESIPDILIHHRIRSVEFDLMPIDGGRWKVDHACSGGNTCSDLESCLSLLRAFDRAVPNHEVVTVFLDVRGDIEGDHGPPSIDAAIREGMDSRNVFTPAELLERCPDATTMQDSVGASGCGWPPLISLLGRFIFVITDANGDEGRIGQYLSGDEGARMAFVAPRLEPAARWVEFPDAVFFNMETRSRGAELREAGLVSRTWGLGPEEWDEAVESQVQHLATNNVSYHNDPDVKTHNSRGWPFHCYDADCGRMRELDRTMALRVASGDIWGEEDSFGFLARRGADHAGAMSAFASVESSSGEDFGKACLMARSGLGKKAAYFAVCRLADDEPMRIQYRTTSGADSREEHAAIVDPDRIRPESAMFMRMTLTAGTGARPHCAEGFGSADGLSWTRIGGACFSHALRYKGLAVSSHDAETSMTFVFGNVYVDGDPVLKPGDFPVREAVGDDVSGFATSENPVF